MLHPSLLYKSSSPECQFSLSSSSQAKIQLRRLALLPLHFTLSVFSSLAAAGCGRRLGSEACQGTRAQSGAKKKKEKKNTNKTTKNHQTQAFALTCLQNQSKTSRPSLLPASQNRRHQSQRLT